MLNASTVFGNVEVDEQTVIDFPLGLPGFEQCHRFKLFHEEGPSPQVMWLASLDQPDVVFSVVEASRLGLQYKLVLSDEESALLGLDSAQPTEVVLLLILIKPSERDPVKPNTHAPILLNTQTRRALQKGGVRAEIIFTNESVAG